MSDGLGWRDRLTRWLPAGYSAALALLILGPLLRPGHLLLRDAVSTPRSYPTDSALGLGDAAPRAVPQDAALAALSSIVDGGIVVKAILIVALCAAGCGAAALARELLRLPVAAQLVATTVAIWNPYVAERLLQGHWSLLTGYAALPWTALAAYRIRRGPRDIRDWLALGGCFAAAGLTPTGALLAGATAVLVVGLRNIGAALALSAIASAPWLMATALSGAGTEPSDPAGIAAFAARAEPGLGTIGSVAGLGGIWNADAVPGSRTTLFALIGTAALLAVVASGVRAVATDIDGAGNASTTRLRVRRILLVLAIFAVLFPALGATPIGRELLEWLVANVPGTGLLRDTQKYVALAMPAYALCAAAGSHALAQRLSQRDHRFDETPDLPDRSDVTANSPTTISEDPSADPPIAAAALPTSSTRPSTVANSSALPANSTTTLVRFTTAVLFAALLILPLPDLAWGVHGAIEPVRYPADWAQVAGKLDGPGDIAVLPGGMFRKFPYTGTAPVLDPAPRMLPKDVLQTGELPVRDHTVAGEGARARAVESLLLHGGSARELAALGVGWVLVEQHTPGPLGDSKNTVAQLNSVYSGHNLTLYRVPGAVDRQHASAFQRALAYAAHILWAALLAAGLLSAIPKVRAESAPTDTPPAPPRRAPRTLRFPFAPKRIRGRGRGPSRP
nr:hypothetical protein [Nocardia arthritidis]